jgi:hypothetical protein
MSEQMEKAFEAWKRRPCKGGQTVPELLGPELFKIAAKGWTDGWKDALATQVTPATPCPIGLDVKGSSEFCSAGYCDTCKTRLATQPQAPQGAVTGWIEWGGGPSGPVGMDVRVDVRFGDSVDHVWEGDPAGEWDWTHGDDPECNIVAYRISAAPETPEGAKP